MYRQEHFRSRQGSYIKKIVINQLNQFFYGKEK